MAISWDTPMVSACCLCTNHQVLYDLTIESHAIFKWGIKHQLLFHAYHGIRSIVIIFNYIYYNIVYLQRLQLEEYGSCVTVADGTKGILDIYIFIVLSFILLGLSFLTSLIRSPVPFHREAVHSLQAITLTLIPISSLDIVNTFLNINVKLTNLEPILWIGFVAELFLPILIMLILFGSSVSDFTRIGFYCVQF
jgi:hypothetical protein